MTEATRVALHLDERVELVRDLFLIRQNGMTPQRMARRTSSSFSLRSCRARCFATAGFSLAKAKISDRASSYPRRVSISRGNCQWTSQLKCRIGGEPCETYLIEELDQQFDLDRTRQRTSCCPRVRSHKQTLMNCTAVCASLSATTFKNASGQYAFWSGPARHLRDCSAKRRSRKTDERELRNIASRAGSRRCQASKHD